jgi:hypothetical protein
VVVVAVVLLLLLPPAHRSSQHPPARLASRGALAPPARTLPPVLRQAPAAARGARPVDLLPLLCRLCHKRLPVDLPALCCLYHKRLPVHLLYGICRLCESFNKVINNNKLIKLLLIN